MTTGPVTVSLAALLVAGHALGDFALQSNGMIQRKERTGGVLVHASVVTTSQAILLTPFLAGPIVLGILVIAVSHALVDMGKIWIVRRVPSRQLEWFVLDQVIHLGVLLGVWFCLAPIVELSWASSLDPGSLTRIGVLVAAYAFNLGGMSAVVGLTLARLGLKADAEGPAIGRVIGMLERTFAVTLILLGHWEALGLLVAAKSLARFKALDQREQAEYYLVGTLVSLLGATLSALAVQAIVR